MIANLDRLRQNELFGSLTDEELSRLAPLCSDFVAVQDAILFTEGRNAIHLYVVTEGQIALQKAIRLPHATRSRRTTLTVCHPGDVVGWSALVEPHKYALSAIAWESSRLINVDAKMLRRALDIYPNMGYKVMLSLSALVSRRMKQTTEVLINERAGLLAGLKL